MTVALSCTLVGLALSAGSVVVEKQHVEVDLTGPEAQLRVRVRVQNTLTVPVADVELGILYATDASALSPADPSRLYRLGDGMHDGVGVLRRGLGMTIAPHKQVETTLVAHVGSVAKAPSAFRMHVLSYALEDITADLVLSLLATNVAADELAAAEAFALLGPVEAKQAARERWQDRPELADELASVVEAPIPLRPDAAATLKRVFAALALGVIGSPRARVALERLLADPDIDLFDEQFQVLRIARLTASSLEAPLAFALDAGASTMHEVVEAATKDLTEWPSR